MPNEQRMIREDAFLTRHGIRAIVSPAAVDLSTVSWRGRARGDRAGRRAGDRAKSGFDRSRREPIIPSRARGARDQTGGSQRQRERERRRSGDLTARKTSSIILGC